MSIVQIWRRSGEAEGNPLHKSFTRIATPAGEVKLDDLGLEDSHDWHRDKQVRERGEIKDPGERALLFQSRANIEALKKLFPQATSLARDSAFGENIVLDGDEFIPTKLCVGDVLHVLRKRRSSGSSSDDNEEVVAILAITSPRWPCYKIDLNHKFPDLVKGEGVRGVCGETGQAGFFCRVLKTGSIQIGDRVIVHERPLPSMTLAYVSRLCYGGTNRETCMIDKFQGTEKELTELLELKQLAYFEWRERLEKYVEKQKQSSTTASASAATNTATVAETRIDMPAGDAPVVPWYRRCCSRQAKQNREYESVTLATVSGSNTQETIKTNSKNAANAPTSTSTSNNNKNNKNNSPDSSKSKTNSTTTNADSSVSKSKNSSSSSSSSTNSTSPAASPTAAATREFTIEEIKASRKILLVISGFVYDVTEYVATHPGGKEVLLENKSTDATEEFEDVMHSKAAKNVMAKLRVGVLARESAVTLSSGGKVTSDFTPWTIKGISTVNHDCISLTLSSPPEVPVPPAWLETDLVWHLSILGEHLDADGQEVCRQYSPLSSVKHWGETKEVTLLIKVYPNGAFTRYLKDCKVGDSLRVGRPRVTLSVPALLDGRASFMDPSPCERPAPSIRIGLVAGGTGICPLIPLLTILLENAKKWSATMRLSIRLVYSNKCLEDILFEKELRAFASEFADIFQVMFSLTREQTVSDEYVRGRVSAEMLKWVGSSEGEAPNHRRLVVCGPKSFDDSISALLPKCGFSLGECLILDA